MNISLLTWKNPQNRVILPLKLSSEQVVQPSLKQGNDTSHEEEPHSPSRLPETHSGTLTDGTSVEPVVDQVLEILAHSDLPHKLVLVTVHYRTKTEAIVIRAITKKEVFETIMLRTSSKLSNVRKHVLETIGQLEGINVSKTELDVHIDNKLGESEDFSTQMD